MPGKYRMLNKIAFDAGIALTGLALGFAPGDIPLGFALGAIVPTAWAVRRRRPHCH